MSFTDTNFVLSEFEFGIRAWTIVLGTRKIKKLRVGIWLSWEIALNLLRYKYLLVLKTRLIYKRCFEVPWDVELGICRNALAFFCLRNVWSEIDRVSRNGRFPQFGTGTHVCVQLPRIIIEGLLLYWCTMWMLEKVENKVQSIVRRVALCIY